MILAVYTPQITNRIRYTFDLVFKEIIGIDIKLMSSIEEFSAFDGLKLCYDHKKMEGMPCFGAVYLLFEKGIKEQDIEVETYEGVKAFYFLRKDEYELPFDPFAAIFFLVTRYEEYLPHVKDHFGRFPAKAGIAFKHNFLHLPIACYYIEMIKDKLRAFYPEIKFPPKEFKYIPTYDVDSAYAYLNKGAVRNVGGLAKSILTADFSGFSDRIMVMIGNKKDPFDSYDWLDEFHTRNDLKPVYFFLVGDYAEYDKNISLSIYEYQELIKSIADSAVVGVHPSFASNDDPEILRREIRNLANVLKRNLTRSRQHFLKLQIPQTYKRLLDNDIEEDYTMGFASHPGFRAGICHPFYFYNLETENKSNLRIYPFAIMDATLNYYLRLSPRKVMPLVSPIIDEIKKFNGTFISLWHNSSFSEEKEWVGWTKVYEDIVAFTLNKKV